VTLCSVDHKWVHANPIEAMALGLIVSRWVDNPYDVPVSTVYGLAMQSCEGGRTPA
jgi:hypothetical protein